MGKNNIKNVKLKSFTKIKQLDNWTIHHKLAAVFILIFFAAVLVIVVPSFRGGVGSLFVKHDMSFKLVETSTGSVIEDADVLFGGKQYKSDSTGVVVIKNVAIGKNTLNISKPFYEPVNTSIVISPFGHIVQRTFNMLAKGEIARLTVKNKISGQVIQGAVVRVGNNGQVHTNSKGIAYLVLPKDTKSAEAKITGLNILDATITLFNANDSTTNIASVIPKGKVFVLKKSNGIIDVVSSNLDGSDSKTVVAGTGKEIVADTQLIMSSGGEYVALKSRRDDELNAKLFVFNSSKNTMNLIDQEQASFIPVGWIGTKFIYTVYKKDVALWSPAKQIIRSYDAVSKLTINIDTTNGEGTSAIDFANESLESVYLISGNIVYTKKWQSSYYYGARLMNKRMSVVSADPEGLKINVIREWQAGYNAYLKSAQSSPVKLNIYIELDGVVISYYTFQDNQVTEQEKVAVAGFTDKNKFPVFYSNQSNISTVWAVKQNSKSSIYLANKKGDGALQIAATSGYDVVGWYDDDYILIENILSSQIFVMSKQGIGSGIVPVKVGDYFKPLQDYRQFGYGK